MDIIVIRSCSGNNISMARPCYHCLELMKAVNIRYCYYSTFEGNIICEKVCNMVSIQISNNNQRNLLTNYEIIMKTLNIRMINRLALDKFIEYNFEPLFPDGYYYIIIKNEITFYNNKNNIITNYIIMW